MNQWHGHLLITFDKRFTPTAAAKRMLCETSGWETILEQIIREGYHPSNEWLKTEKGAIAYMQKGGHWVLAEEESLGYFNPIRTQEAREKHRSTQDKYKEKVAFLKANGPIAAIEEGIYNAP